MREVHSAQGEKTDRPHAQMLFAAGAKCPLSHADRCADFGKIKRPVGICLQKLFEPRDDRIMPPGNGVWLSDRIGEASDHDVHELILQCAKHLRQLQKVGSIMRELPYRPV